MPVREPAFAGSGYPGTRAEIERFCAQGSPARERALGLVAPHAGWVYSGAIARETYDRVLVPATAVVLCPNHRVPPPVLAVWDRGSWRTPLREASIDEALAARLLAECRATGAGLRPDTRAHEREHAVELHLPLLQNARADVRIVPVVVGVEADELRAFGEALARAVRGHDREALLVASSDMNHFESAQVAARKDRLALDRVLALDPDGLLATCDEHGVSMCGSRPTAALLHAARALGATRAELVRYGHSGEVSGDQERVVAYAGIVIR